MRESGILMPVSSLPGPYGIGCFGKEAFKFVDFLADAGQKIWQLLPLSPTGYGDSPYQSCSAFAGNPYFIDLDALKEEGLLTAAQLKAEPWGDDPKQVDYGTLYTSRYKVLRTAYAAWRKAYKGLHGCSDYFPDDYYAFTLSNEAWLEDYALYMVLKVANGMKNWVEWERPYRLRDKAALAAFAAENEEEIGFWKFVQYKFSTQWQAVKQYANDKGVQILGDIPIYVSADSVDAWVGGKLFELDAEGRFARVAGCPPDGFTADGQLWGNPIYDWEYHKKQNYAWWIRRIRQCEVLYDVVRIDHFRGFDEYYTIPYGMTNARIGEWKKGPGIALFHEVKKHVKNIEIIAEDLGYMTQSVRDLVAETGYPGMKVLQFAFGSGSDNEYLPHNYTPNSVVYTGTHDNETLMQYLECTEEHVRNHIREYMNRPHASNEELCENLIWMAMSSVGKYCMIPLQDYLGLGKEARMNYPSTLGHNWEWRVRKEQLTHDLASYIAHMTGLSYRWRIDPPKEEETNETDTENE